MDRANDTLLYAGSAKARITDWFFFKDHITLHYVGLDDAVVNMKRSDSTWNYKFLLDYFASPTSNRKDTSGGIAFDFKEAHFKNIRFNRIDGWIGQNMVGSMKKMDLFVDSADLTKQKIYLKELNFDEPHFALSDYTGNKPKQNVVTDTGRSAVNITAPKAEEDGWTVQIKKVLLNDGRFKSDQETERLPYTDRFDGQHLFISSIDGTINDVLLKNDTLTASIRLAAKERSGFMIKDITSSVKFTSEMMEFKDLDLKTNKSHLKNYYAMRYENFNDDMKGFLHNVRLEGRFTDSELSSDDLAFFAPALSSWKRTFYFNGNAHGTIDNLSAKDMKITNTECCLISKKCQGS